MVAAHPFRFGAALLLCGGLYFGFVSAQTNDTKKTPHPALLLPLVLETHATPKNRDDLASIENHVQKVLPLITPAVVGVRVGAGQGSGVIVSANGLILTAGHVSGKPGQAAFITLPDGTTVKGITLGQNKGIDSGMVKIVPDEKNKDKKYPFIEMGNSSELTKGQWVMAIGHPGGFRKNRPSPFRLGRILVVSPFLIRTDCALVGGDSGGPLFDMHGKVVGIHSRIGGMSITENIHVPVDTFRQTWDRLVKGESWGGQLGQIELVRSAGGKVVLEKKDKLTTEDPTMPAPADAKEKTYFKQYTYRMKAGHTYTIDLSSNERFRKKKADPTYDPFVRLESPTKKSLAEDDDGAGAMNARIVYKAIKDGDYRIIATSYDKEQTGSFTLKIYEADFKDFVVSGRVDLLKAMRIPPPAVSSLVEKFAQAKVPLYINALLIDDKGDPQPNKEITLNWEKGTETLKSDRLGVVRWPLAKEKSRKLNLQLPKGIRAMVAVTDTNGTSLGLFSKEDPSIEKVKSAGGTIIKTIDGAIAKSDPFDPEREKCYRHIHDLKMQAGKTYTIDLSSEEIDSYLRLENDDKGKVAEDDDGAGNLNSRIVYTPTSGGAYRIVVTTCDPGQHGTYRLIVREADAKATESKKEAAK